MQREAAVQKQPPNTSAGHQDPPGRPGPSTSITSLYILPLGQPWGYAGRHVEASRLTDRTEPMDEITRIRAVTLWVSSPADELLDRPLRPLRNQSAAPRGQKYVENGSLSDPRGHAWEFQAIMSSSKTTESCVSHF